MFKKRKKDASLMGAVQNYYLICNTLLLLVFGICMLGISTRVLINKVEDSSEMITEQAVYTLDKTFNDIASQMVSFSSYRDLWNKFSKSNMSIQEKLDVNRELNNILKKTDLFNSVVQDIFVISDNGYYFTTVGQDGLAANYDYWSKDWYQETKNTTGNVYVHILGLHDQDFYSTKRAITAKNKTFSISFALQNSKGKVSGALIYNFDLSQLAEVLGASSYEENGKVAILNEDGVIMSRSDNSEIGSVLQVSDEDREIMKNEKTGSFWTNVGGKRHFVSFQTTSMGLKLVSYIPQSEIFRHTRSMIWLLVLIILCSLVLNLLITFKVSGSIKKPIQKLMDNIQNVDSQKLVLETEEYHYEELNQIADRFNGLLKRLNSLIDKDYKSQILINKFRLYSLQSQINPYFLMNTLQQLQTEIVYGNVEESNDIIVDLSKMLRYSLYHYEEMVPISMELQYIQSYLELFTRKYEGELQAVYEITDEIEGYYMPKMLLQPIAENCIMHAFGENPHGAVIKLSVKKKEDCFLFSIEDNGTGMDKEQLDILIADLNISEIDNRRIGIRNIHQRIRLKYGDGYGVHIESQKGQGTKFVIKIPLLNQSVAEKESL